MSIITYRNFKSNILYYIFYMVINTFCFYLGNSKCHTTSNICTNNSLCALAAAMYMASLGGSGMRELAILNHDKSEYLKGQLGGAGLPLSFETPTFNEFVVKCPKDFRITYEHLVAKKIVAGLPLEPYYPELAQHYLLCATETKSKEDMDDLVKEIVS